MFLTYRIRYSLFIGNTIHLRSTKRDATDKNKQADKYVLYSIKIIEREDTDNRPMPVFMLKTNSNVNGKARRQLYMLIAMTTYMKFRL